MAKIDATKLGEYIREQRGAAQISLRQLAKAADISNPYLSQVERGLRKPSAEILARIASGLAITVGACYVGSAMIARHRAQAAADLAALAAAAPLDSTSMMAASGTCVRSHPLHWVDACGWAAMEPRL